MSERDNSFLMVGLGEVLWDLLPGGRQLGGAPANFAWHAAALGGRGAVASCIGDDDLGRQIIERLDAMGLDRTAVAVDSEHPTGTVSVELDSSGDAGFTIHENVAWDFIPSAPAFTGLAARADAVCFGSLAQRSPVSRETIAAFLQATRGGCLRIFDINLRQSYYSREVIIESLGACEVLKLNDEELPAVAELLEMSGTQDELLCELLRRHSLRLVVLTCGSSGSTLRTADEVSVLPGRKVDVADTVGAGDAFTAAVATGLLEGRDLSAVHRLADRLATYVCTRAGATPALPAELREAQ